MTALPQLMNARQSNRFVLFYYLTLFHYLTYGTLSLIIRMHLFAANMASVSVENVYVTKATLDFSVILRCLTQTR